MISPIMPNFKTKLSTPRQSAVRQQLQQWQTQYQWQTLSEQYCLYRLDGTTATGGWVRVKQYANGTLFIDAASPTGLAQLLGQLGFEAPPNAANDAANVSTPGVAGPVGAGSSVVAPPYAGSDESGKGDYFGPLVVAAVCLATPAIQAAVVGLGVADSKTLTDTRIGRLMPDLLAALGPQHVHVTCLMPAQYNQSYVQHGSNLNTLLSKTHAYTLGKLCSKATVPPTLAIIDQFGTAAKIQQHCRQLPMPVQTHTKAESQFVAVAAASCLARHTFVTRMAQLSDQWGIALPLGASNPVKQAIRAFVRQHGQAALAQVAKTHFKMGV
jgi:ribonuclease HIII